MTSPFADGFDATINANNGVNDVKNGVNDVRRLHCRQFKSRHTPIR
ncbi:MAG: hypothetical protein LBB87_04685 [Nitrososphaerota archaeon]|nr:hypothetical protein [Nitrososphaerota archaeon]